MKVSLATLAWIWLCACCAGTLAFSVFKFLHREWLPAAYLAVIGVAAVSMTVLCLWSLSRQESPPDIADPTGKIVMRVGSEALATTLFWAAGFLIASAALAENPDLLWTRWLSYPAALVALLLSGLMLFIVWGQKLERVIADAQGIEVRTEARGAIVPGDKVAWAQVGAVKRVSVYVKKISRGGGSSEFARREFVLLDRGGEELLNLEDPLDPPDKYQRFLETIPRWTGLPVKEERVTK